jgi:DNA modification methylase
MTSAVLAPTTVLRTAAGEPPLGPNGLSFRLDQGETFEHPEARYRNPATTIAVLELDSGKWLARPPGFMIDGVLHDDRAAALAAAIEGMAARAETFMANGDGDGTHWSEAFGGAVKRWAFALRSSEPSEEITSEANPNDVLGQKTASGDITDPVIRALCAANRARKVYPAGHTFAMTNPVINGVMMTMGTCSCGDSFSYTFGSYERMDAAIEAHRRKFDHLAEKVDGRGNPISGEEGADANAKPKAARKRRSAPKAAEAHDLGNAPLPEPSSVASHAAGDGSPLHPFPDWFNPADAAWMATDEGHRFEALRWVINGWSSDVDSEVLRDLIGIGYLPATAVMVTDEGQAWLDETQAKISSDGGGENQPEQRTGPHRESGETNSGATGDSELTRSAHQPSEANSDAGAASQASDPAPAVSSLSTGAGEIEPAQILIPAEPAQICAGVVGCAGDLKPGDTAPDGGIVVSDAVAAAVEYAMREGAVTLTADILRGEMPLTPPLSPQECSERGEGEEDDLTLDWPSYDRFLEDKVVTAPLRGIEVARDSLHPYLKPHCKDLVVWSLRLGCAAIFASFGLHKTAMQLEWCRQLARRMEGATLSVVPLGVRHGFIKESDNLAMDVRFIRTHAEYQALRAEGVAHFLTNYESIREGKLDPNLFVAVSLDEASVLRSYGSKTFQEFLPLFAKVPFKLVATATPSPNRYKELIHYSGFLGVMDTGLALTRFFQRNSEKAGDLTLYPHKEDEFWMWVHSWAAFLQKPSELGYSDEGYQLPPLTIRWHEVPADHSKAEPERDGQGVMFRKGAASLADAARSRRDSLSSRVAKMLELLAQDPQSHRILWHDLEAEREAIEAAVPGVVAITGSGMDIDEREKHLHDFEEGRTKYFATKPILSGSGSNFQYHCHKAVYVGLPGEGYKFNDWIQSIYRLQRFGQQRAVEIDIIYSEDMRAGRAVLEEKWALDTAMRARMSEIIAAHGLNTLPLRDALLRKMGIERVEIRGQNFIAINNDAVAETRTWPENSVDLIVSSIPFSNHYEYSPSYRDFGHTDDNGHFWQQMDFLTLELQRMLKPGRLACIHVKDRVLFGSVTGEGVPTISPFHAEAIMHYRAHGLQFMGMITVVTDVVRENNQTYRLGWSENAKDSTKMGVGSPEYVLLFRKRQSDRSRGYADLPVTKVNARLGGVAEDVETQGYSRARWQLDAHALWRSSSNRLLTPEEFAMLDTKGHAKLFSKISAERIYNYEAHVRIGENLERQGILPAQFMAIAPGSPHPDVWHDVARMRTLNMMQQRKGQEQHLCPLQFDIVDRLIERYSNPGEMVFDPFGGLMTVPYCALRKGRRGGGCELNPTYFLDGVQYLRMAEEEMETPQLFDLVEFDQADTPSTSLMETSDDGR